MIDFTRYRATERKCCAYIEDPEKLDTLERCQRYDQTAERYISEMEQELEEMRQYRRQLFERMQKLYSTPYHLRLTLKRERRGYNPSKVFFFLLIEKVFEGGDISPEVVSNQKYTGAERAKAIADFKAEQKRRPGIDSVMDIAKGRWER